MGGQSFLSLFMFIRKVKRLNAICILHTCSDEMESVLNGEQLNEAATTCPHVAVTGNSHEENEEMIL